MEVLDHYGAHAAGIPRRVFDCLQRQGNESAPESTCRATHHIIGNNAVAVDAAGEKAVALGYSPVLHAATECEGFAEGVGRHLAHMARQMLAVDGPDCLISGGEPVVPGAGSPAAGAELGQHDQ